MNREEAKFEVSKCIGEIDDSFLEEANRYKVGKRKKILLPFVACIALLCGAFATTRDITVYNLGAGHTYITWKELDGSIGTETYFPQGEERDVLERRDDELYYVFENREENITNLVSTNQYLADFRLDEEGSGFILVVGGDITQAGFSFYFYQYGKYIFGTYDLNSYHPTENRLDVGQWGNPYSAQQYAEAHEEDSIINGKKVTPWIYHADCQFVGDIPEEFWCEYPETANFSYGSGEKINDTLYRFRADGEDFIGLTTEEILTMYEEVILIQHYEDISITEWKVEFIGEYEEKITLFLTLPEGKTWDNLLKTRIEAVISTVNSPYPCEIVFMPERLGEN